MVFHNLSSTNKELLTSVLLIGAVVGALFAGKIADKIGRRPTVLGTRRCPRASWWQRVRRRGPGWLASSGVPCGPCSAGEWDFCRNGRYTERGIKQLDGYGSQLWTVETGFAIKVAPGLGDAGVLLEPASVLAKAWEQTDRIFTRATWRPTVALVTGAGPIGLFAALLGTSTHPPAPAGVRVK